LNESVRYFNAALQLDPHYALAYAGLGKTYSVMAIYGVMDDEEAWNKSRDAAVRALEIDPQIAEAHMPLAAVAIFHDRNWSRADEETRRALEIDPASDAHTLRGYLLQAMGLPEEGLAELRRERELDPLWIIAQNDCIVGAFFARHYDEVIRDGTQVLKIQPRNNIVRFYVGKALRMKKRLDEAAVLQQANLQHVPRYVRSIGELGAISAQRGDRVAALARVEQLEQLRPSDKLRRTDYALAALYAALDDHDHAFQAFDEAIRNHYPFMCEMRTDAAFDSLRTDPRYRELLAKLNL